SYTVGGAKVLDTPSLEGTGDAKAFVRSFTVSGADSDLSLMVLEGSAAAALSGDVASCGDVKVALVGAPAGAKLVAADKQIHLDIPKPAGAVNFKVVITKGDAA